MGCLFSFLFPGPRLQNLYGTMFGICAAAFYVLVATEDEAPEPTCVTELHEMRSEQAERAMHPQSEKNV